MQISLVKYTCTHVHIDLQPQFLSPVHQVSCEKLLVRNNVQNEAESRL